MARAIDADAIVEEFWKPEYRTQTRRDFIAAIQKWPTLTPPNEWVTLEQLRASPHGKIKDSTLQSICNRANEIACRPPEGEEGDADRG